MSSERFETQLINFGTNIDFYKTCFTFYIIHENCNNIIIINYDNALRSSTKTAILYGHLNFSIQVF